MYSRWFNIVVLILWLSTMGWLVYEKVLPPLWTGQRPDYENILESRQDDRPVGWDLRFNGRSIGWAVSTTDSQSNGLTELRSFVHFQRIPLPQLTPGWFQAMIHLVEGPALDQPMDAESTLWIDPLHRLARFDSSVSFTGQPELLRLRGSLEGSHVDVSIQSGDFLYRTEVPIPQDALMADVFSPQTTLPKLREGQTWSAPAFSPLRPPNQPLEILQAQVTGLEPVSYNGQMEHVWVVVYRTDPGAVLGHDDGVRGRLWVRRDGTVIQQQVKVFDSVLTFVRVSEDEALRLQTQAARLRAVREQLLPLPDADGAAAVDQRWPAVPPLGTIPDAAPETPATPPHAPARPAPIDDWPFTVDPWP